MQIVKDKVSIETLKKMSKKMFEDLVKAVVDIEKKILIIDDEMHADMEFFMLKQGSSQEHLWGINIWPFENDANLIEFDSIINLRPSWGNRSRSVDDPAIQKEIINFVTKKIES